MGITKKHLRIMLLILLICAVAVTFMPVVNGSVYATGGPIITTDKTEYQVGEDIMVTTQINGASGGWIALYPANTKQYNMSIYWYYPERFPETRPLIGTDINTNDENWGTGSSVEGLPAGEYQLVYAYGSGYPYSIQGAPTYFTILEGAPSHGTIRTNKKTYNYSDPITVTANCETEGCWVGLYGTDETPSEELKPIFRNDVSGTEPFDLKGATANRAFETGEYKVILFGDSGYTNILYTIPITIVEDPSPADELTLSFVESGKTTYKLGEPVYIKATGTAEGAWVGLYHSDDKTDPNSGGATSLRWFYVSKHNGEKVDITDPFFDDNGKGGLTEGDYKIILFGDNGYSNEVDELDFTVDGIIDIDTDSFSLDTNKTNYVSGEDIKVTAKGTGIEDGAWVGLYPSDTTSFGKFYLFKYKVKGNEGIEVVMQGQEKGSASSGKVEDGFYKVVLFANSGYNLPVLTKEISVTKASTSIKRIKDPGCVTLGLEYIVYEDGTDAYRQIPSLGGHIWGDPEHIEGTAKHVYTCKRDSDHKREENCKGPAKVTRQASIGKSGTLEYTCEKCGGTREEAIYAIQAPTLTQTEFVYTGNTVKPVIKNIVDVKGKVLDSDQYTVTYPVQSNAVGTYSVKIDFKDRYTGTATLLYRIVPKAAPSVTTQTVAPQAVAVKKVKAKSKSFKVTWKKASESVTGYQIAYTTKKNFSSYKTKNVNNINKTSLTVKKLKKKKKYYVKVRTYKIVGGTYYYSAWSNVKRVKTKK